MADFLKMMQQAQQMQGRLQQLEGELQRMTVTGSAGGGLVTVEADGKGQVRRVSIDPKVVNPADVEMLEDLVAVAVGEAQKKAAALAQTEMGKLTGGLDLPFKLPVLARSVSAIEELVTELARLPTIGRKSALRLTYHLLRQPAEQSKRLAQALVALVERVRRCERCFNLTEDPLCAICADPRRDAGLICVVEEASDISAIERSGEYRGVYHVLGGRLSPLDGVGPDDLTVDALVRRVTEGGAREVIVATNLKLEGEATALYVQEQLAPLGVAVSRIARGIPVGGDLEYADGVTIAQAMAARREMR